MKIFCFYNQDDVFEYQEKIIELWKLTWGQFGFEPIVLGSNDIKDSIECYKFIEKINSIHYIIKNKIRISEYGMNCFLRWLAYSERKEDFFLVSDYDVINLGLTPADVPKECNFMTGHCPSIVSGTQEDFKKIYDSFVRETKQNIGKIVNNSYVKNTPHFHDQEFFVSVLDEHFCKNNKIKLTIPNNSEHPIPQYFRNKFVHVSHSYVHNFMLNGFKFENKIHGEYPTEAHRIELMEFLIKTHTQI